MRLRTRGRFGGNYDWIGWLLRSEGLGYLSIGNINPNAWDSHQPTERNPRGHDAHPKLTMPSNKRARQRGAGILEFTLAGIPLICLMISVVETSRGMWNYHTLARAVNQTARLASVRGQGCATNGNSCRVMVGTLTRTLVMQAIGLPQSDLNVTLVTDSGAVTTCNPVSSCTSNTTYWPPSANSDYSTGKTVTVTAQYTFRSALAMFWPGQGAVQF